MIAGGRGDLGRLLTRGVRGCRRGRRTTRAPSCLIQDARSTRCSSRRQRTRTLVGRRCETPLASTSGVCLGGEAGVELGRQLVQVPVVRITSAPVVTGARWPIWWPSRAGCTSCSTAPWCARTGVRPLPRASRARRSTFGGPESTGRPAGTSKPSSRLRRLADLGLRRRARPLAQPHRGPQRRCSRRTAWVASQLDLPTLAGSGYEGQARDQGADQAAPRRADRRPMERGVGVLGGTQPPTRPGQGVPLERSLQFQRRPLTICGLVWREVSFPGRGCGGVLTAGEEIFDAFHGEECGAVSSISSTTSGTGAATDRRMPPPALRVRLALSRAT